MDSETLMDAAMVYSVSIDNTWSFIFTMIFAAVGFLATLRQVFSDDHRSQGRYKVLVRVVQVGMLIFVINGIVALGELFYRLNTVMAAIQEKTVGEGPALVRAFEPYVFKPQWMLDACPPDFMAYCDHNLPISLLVFAPAAVIVILLMPMIAGFHGRSSNA